MQPAGKGQMHPRLANERNCFTESRLSGGAEVAADELTGVRRGAVLRQVA